MGFMIDAAVCSSIGGRKNNEDNFYFNGAFMERGSMDKGDSLSAQSAKADQIYAVFDGMGGGELGEFASSYAAGQMKQYQQDNAEGPDRPEKLRGFLTETSLGVSRISEENGFRAGACGCTAAIVILGNGWFRTAHVGDSRIYLLRDGELKRVTKDQSLVQRLVDSGEITPEEAWAHPKKNVITHHIGMTLRGGELQTVIGERTPLAAGDCLLICSDGVSDSLRDDEIQRALDPGQSAQTNATGLVALAEKRAGEIGVPSDNVTAVILRVQRIETEEERERQLNRMKRMRSLWAACAGIFTLGAAGAIVQLIRML